ncbi:serine/threonine dehydratase [Asticcacaulis excentricus]|uniref:Threonine dehydratase, catabolic n=1 Tax=Asticcacaulis excentricus TaxID=78587 RepID=A0A3G9G5Z5_9CAUL|nr:serine/threonine dehydratase [Asticcacaulis excentricus]BBF81345.1 threonine dehydratase, catabolic [Asticcacaulis excentricus]
MNDIRPEDIAAAQARITGQVHRTPLIQSDTLNKALGHRVVFKAENLQKIGAFKLRGATNTLWTLKEQNALSDQVCAFSSGNHAQAVAYAARALGVKATIFIPKQASGLKIAATRACGAEVVVTETRQAAEAAVADYIERGATFVHPYDNPHVIAGQGTACLEALQDGVEADAVFAPCGGGGLMSGTWLATRLARPQAKVFACEPSMANDAHRSVQSGEIVRLTETPMTIADGVRTLAVSERTLFYLRQIDGFFEVDESDIIRWTQWLTHLLKLTIEPTSAMCMAGVAQWLKTQPAPRTVLVILSGGNIGADTHRQTWAEDRLLTLPW